MEPEAEHRKTVIVGGTLVLMLGTVVFYALLLWETISHRNSEWYIACNSMFLAAWLILEYAFAKHYLGHDAFDILVYGSFLLCGALAISATNTIVVLCQNDGKLEELVNEYGGFTTVHAIACLGAFGFALIGLFCSASVYLLQKVSRCA